MTRRQLRGAIVSLRLFRANRLLWPHTFTKSDHAKIIGGFDLISDALRFGRLWYLEVDDAIDYAKHRGRAHDAVIRLYRHASDVIEAHEHTGLAQRA